jgi:hypothetical protein
MTCHAIALAQKEECSRLLKVLLDLEFFRELDSKFRLSYKS